MDGPTNGHAKRRFSPGPTPANAAMGTAKQLECEHCGGTVFKPTHRTSFVYDVLDDEKFATLGVDRHYCEGCGSMLGSRPGVRFCFIKPGEPGFLEPDGGHCACCSKRTQTEPPAGDGGHLKLVT